MSELSGAGGGLPGVNVTGSPAALSQGLVSTSATSANWQNVMLSGAATRITAVSGSPSGFGYALISQAGVSGGTVSMSWASVLVQAANTAVAGQALINGTGNIISGNIPNDSSLHTVIVSAAVTVTTLETGGAIQAQWTIGGVVQTSTIFPGGQAVGTTTASFTTLVDPNTSVLLNQSSALTAGAATIRAQICVC